jgi:DNA-binding LytR/AlgR family response regulator
LATPRQTNLATKTLPMAKNDFFYRDKRVLKRIDISTVNGLEVEKNYVRFYSTEGKHMVRIPLKEALARLPEKEFAQINRLQAIAVRLIQQITRDTIIIHGEDGPIELPLKNMYRKGLLKCVTILEKEVKRPSRSRRDVEERNVKKRMGAG